MDRIITRSKASKAKQASSTASGLNNSAQVWICGSLQKKKWALFTSSSILESMEPNGELFFSTSLVGPARLSRFRPSYKRAPKRPKKG